MWARFTVLSDTPIAAAIAGCAIPLSRNNTIWMRWRCAAGIFHRSAVFSRRTSALLHLTICSSESDGSSESHLHAEKQPVQAVSLPCPNRPDSRRYGAGISWRGDADDEHVPAGHADLATGADRRRAAGGGRATPVRHQGRGRRPSGDRSESADPGWGAQRRGKVVKMCDEPLLPSRVLQS